MMHPRFSVIIPVHNAERTVAAALESVLAQSFTDFEVIVIDDGSTDDSIKAMLPFMGNDERVRMFAKSQEGVSATRNFGVELARGELIAFLDADDCWNPKKLFEHFCVHVADPEVEASFAKIALRGERADGTLAEPIPFSTMQHDPIDLDAVLSENPVCTASNLVIRRTSFLELGGFRSAVNHCENQEFLARFVDEGRRIACVDRWLVDYRLSPNGLSCDYDAMLEGWRSLAAQYEGRFNMRRAEAIYSRYLARRVVSSGGSAALARRMALNGLRADWRAFFCDARHGGLTLGTAIGGALLPQSVRATISA